MRRLAGGRRILLLAVAALMSLSALLAVGILLFGHFGTVEGRILGTTALLAGYGVLALPAAVLVDQRRLRGLALSLAALAAVAAALALTSIWSGGGSDTLGKSVGTATLFAIALAQTGALAARRREGDPELARVLFPASIALAAAATALASALLWHGGGPGGGRIVGALVVLDLLAAVLQPTLARAQQQPEPIRLRLRVEGGEAVDLTLAETDFASAAAKAIRSTERGGRVVVGVERLGEDPAGLVRGPKSRGADQPSRSRRAPTLTQRTARSAASQRPR